MKIAGLVVLMIAVVLFLSMKHPMIVAAGGTLFLIVFFIFTIVGSVRHHSSKEAMRRPL